MVMEERCKRGATAATGKKEGKKKDKKENRKENKKAKTLELPGKQKAMINYIY